MERFLATNDQDGTVIMGVWEDVCDLDKRIWNVRLFTNEEPIETPLAYIEMVEDYWPNSKDIKTTEWIAIFDHHELVGVYL